MIRRKSLSSTLTAGVGAIFWPAARSFGRTADGTTQPEPVGFFTLGERKGHWWFTATTKFHMLHSGGNNGDGGSCPTRHLQDTAPNEMWEHDAANDPDRIRAA